MWPDVAGCGRLWPAVAGRTIIRTEEACDQTRRGKPGKKKHHGRCERTKVGKLDGCIRTNENVVALDVAVNDAAVVEVGQPRQRVFHDDADVLLFQWLVRH